MARGVSWPFCALLVFYLSLSASVSVAEETILFNEGGKRRSYSRGDLIPVTCLNRTIETGEHITDSHGNLQYIPFPTCNETNQPLSFRYAVSEIQTCTIDSLPDELYHLIEFFVHSDVPLTCRIPTYPLSFDNAHALSKSSSSSSTDLESTLSSEPWTPFTIALQGKLQLSHMHLHTNINVLFHTSNDETQLIGSTAYSLPDTSSPLASPEGTKIFRNEPLVLTFNIGWVDGAVLPGMAGRPVLGVKDHSLGFSLLSFFALAASAGIGAMGMLVYERHKSGRSTKYGNGILGGNVGGNGVARSSGYGGYGGYSGYNGGGTGKRD